MHHSDGQYAKPYLVLIGFASLTPVPPEPLGVPVHRWSVVEYLAEESRHGGLGERVGALLGRVLGRGEAVLGAAVHFHLPCDLGDAEVLEQLIDLLERAIGSSAPCRMRKQPLMVLAA